jgi:hypothetical protein
MNLKEVGWDVLGLIYLPQNACQRNAVVKESKEQLGSINDNGLTS